MWQSLIDKIAEFNAAINGVVWGWPVIILILGTGLLLSLRTGFLQVRRFGDSLKTTIIPAVRSLGAKKQKGDTKLKTVSQDVGIIVILAWKALEHAEFAPVLKVLSTVCIWIMTVLTVVSAVNYCVKNRDVFSETK